MNLFFEYHSNIDCIKEIPAPGQYTLKGGGKSCPVYRGNTNLWYETWDVLAQMGKEMILSYCYDKELINEIAVATIIPTPQREIFFKMHHASPIKLVDITVPPDFYDKTIERLIAENAQSH